METLVWLRVPGDVVFSIGGLTLGAYALRLIGRRRAADEMPLGVAAAE